MLTVFHMGAFDLLGGLVALRHLHAVADPAHVDLGNWGTLPGVDALRENYNIELAVNLDGIALRRSWR